MFRLHNWVFFFVSSSKSEMALTLREKNDTKPNQCRRIDGIFSIIMICRTIKTSPVLFLLYIRMDSSWFFISFACSLACLLNFSATFFSLFTTKRFPRAWQTFILQPYFFMCVCAQSGSFIIKLLSDLLLVFIFQNYIKKYFVSIVRYVCAF